MFFVRAVVALVAGVALGGCGFTKVDGGGSEPADASVDPPDLSGDGEPPDQRPAPADLAGCGCGCAPTLLVSVTNRVSNVDVGGRVRRYALTADGMALACGPDLTAEDKLPAKARSLAWVPPDAVAYGSDDLKKVYVVDATTNKLRWGADLTSEPSALFPVETSKGDPVVAVGLNDTMFGDIRSLTLFDPASGASKGGWSFVDTASAMKIGPVDAMARSPRYASSVMVAGKISNNEPAAAEAMLPTGTVPTAAVPYVDTIHDGPSIRAMTTLRKGTLWRTAWLMAAASFTAPSTIYYANDTGSNPHKVIGPLGCTLADCAQAFRASSVVPDPRAADRVIAVCAAPGSTANVVTIDAAGACTMLVPAAAFPVDSYPAQLALVEVR